MKTLKKHLKRVALFCATLIFFQGCTVYQSVNVTFEKASKTNNKVKITTNDNQTLKFKRIGFEDGLYFGVKKINGEMIKTQIDEQKIEKVQLKDETLSTIITVVFPLALIGLLAVLIYGDMIGGYSNGFH